MKLFHWNCWKPLARTFHKFKLSADIEHLPTRQFGADSVLEKVFLQCKQSECLQACYSFAFKTSVYLVVFSSFNSMKSEFAIDWCVVVDQRLEDLPALHFPGFEQASNKLSASRFASGQTQCWVYNRENREPPSSPAPERITVTLCCD